MSLSQFLEVLVLFVFLWYSCLSMTEELPSAASENPENISAETGQKSFFLKKGFEWLRARKRFFFVLAVVLLALGIAYRFRGQVVVAMVNRRPIFRWQLIRQLEKQSGALVANRLITEKLINQEAKKRGINVSDTEVAQEFSRLESDFKEQGQDLDQVLGIQGMSRDDLADQIKIQKMLEKMIGDDVEVTDEEVKTIFEKQKDNLPEGSDPEKIKENLQENLRQQKLGEKVQELLKSLRENGNIKNLLFPG